MKEADRLYVLRLPVEEFDERHQHDNVHISGLEEDDWRIISAYIEVVQPFIKASKLLGGDTYPAACMVVPMVDQLLHDLQVLPDKMAREEARQERIDLRDGRLVVNTWGPDREGRRLVERAIERFHVR